MNLKTLTVSAVTAAVYVVLTFFIAPLAFSGIQFRISEMLNHLVIFNKKYFFGIIIGVFVGNLLFSPMLPYDLIFGTAQSVIALLTTMICSIWVKNRKSLFAINIIVFTVTMGIIAWELAIVLHFPFLLTWLTTAIGEFVVMLIGVPIMTFVNKRLHLETRI